jgi:hypothetical protein
MELWAEGFFPQNSNHTNSQFYSLQQANVNLEINVVKSLEWFLLRRRPAAQSVHGAQHALFEAFHVPE